MSQSTPTASALTSQYTAQVAGDLESNIKEQERVSAEISALTEQLSTLQRDHSVLVGMQEALGIAPAHAEPEATTDSASATVPAPREKAETGSGTARRTRAKKAGTAQSRTTTKKAPAKKPAAKAADQAGGKAANKASAAKKTQPTLVELVRGHLLGQSGPRSAAEVATALGQAHPERGIKTTVVRTTLEGLVAKYQAQRAKRGSSVFYTAPETPAPEATPSTEARTDRAG